MKKLCIAIAACLPLLCSAQRGTPGSPRQVAVFLSSECPISQKYISVLNKIYKEYGNNPSLQWRFIITDDISSRNLRAFVEEFNVEFPVQKDDNKRTITRDFMASVTPQVVIKGKEILYSGAIDNWFFELGQYRQVVTENYFTDALDQVLDGRAPSIKETEPVGCPIAKPTR